jgi:hypothetical protein
MCYNNHNGDVIGIKMDSFEHPTSRDVAKWTLRDLVDILSNYYTLIDLEEDQSKKDKLIEMAADTKSHMGFLQDYLSKEEEKEKGPKKENSAKNTDIFEISFLGGLDPKIKKKEAKK